MTALTPEQYAELKASITTRANMSPPSMPNLGEVRDLFDTIDMLADDFDEGALTARLNELYAERSEIYATLKAHGREWVDVNEIILTQERDNARAVAAELRSVMQVDARLADQPHPNLVFPWETP